MIERLLSLHDPVVIAHRGGAGLHPENTMAAFGHAASLGVDGLECDVHLSRDGHPVVIHDATLDRTTDGRGPVSALTADALAGLDAGCRFVRRDGGPASRRAGGVPALSTLLAAHPAMPVVIEIKGEHMALVDRVLDVVHRARAESRVMIGGFSDVVLRGTRERAGQVPTSASTAEVRAALRRAWLRWPPRRTGYRAFQIPVRHRGRTVLSPKLVALSRSVGIPVHAWVIDDAIEMRRLLAAGVTGIITDRPDVAMDVLAPRRAHP